LSTTIAYRAAVLLLVIVCIGVAIGYAISTQEVNRLQQERNELLANLEATLTLQQSIAIDTKAQEVIPSMSTEVSFAFSTEFKGELVNIQPDRLRVLMLDAEGREIDRIPDGRIIRVNQAYQGVYMITLDARYLPPGVYVLIISAEHPVQISIYPIQEEVVKGSTVVTILRE